MARQSRSQVKSMLIIFFDCEGVVNYGFAPRGQTINKEYYVEVLKRLRDAVRRKRPRFWLSGDWLLQIPKSAFEDCFKMWKHRWERVVQSNGDYFEGCHGPADEE